MQLSYSDKNDIPEGSADSFVEFKEGENTVYMHKDLADAKKEAFRTKGDLTKANEKLANVDERLAAFEKEKADALEAQRLKDEQDKVKNGQSQEIIDDLRKQITDMEGKHGSELQELRQGIANEKKNALVADLASVASKGNERVLNRMIADDVTVNEDGTVVFKDTEGKATALTAEQYRESLRERYPTLVAGVQSSGGNASGGNGEPSGGDNMALYRQNVPGFKDLPKN